MIPEGNLLKILKKHASREILQLQLECGNYLNKLEMVHELGDI